MAIHYSTIGRDFTITGTISELSGRDKLNLLNDLLRELGIMEDMINDPVLSEKFIAVYKKAQDKYWIK
jgi:hypothetical protein